MKRILALCVLLFPFQVLAALPTQYQNLKDLHVMEAYIANHPKVAATLRSIDLEKKTVFFGQGCTALFTRKESIKLPGWTGPAEPLILKEVVCPDNP